MSMIETKNEAKKCLVFCGENCTCGANETLSGHEPVVMREKMRGYAKVHYKRKHTDADYLEFMNRHPCSFAVNPPQSVNYPYYWTLFTVKSQHVLGDCIEECLDKAMIA